MMKRSKYVAMSVFDDEIQMQTERSHVCVFLMSDEVRRGWGSLINFPPDQSGESPGF